MVIQINFFRLPVPAIPKFRHFTAFILDAVVIAIVNYSVTVSVGKLLAKKHGYHINPGQVWQEFFNCKHSTSEFS